MNSSDLLKLRSGYGGAYGNAQGVSVQYVPMGCNSYGPCIPNPGCLVKGPPGSTGPEGPAGPTGMTGVAGDTGATGFMGATGFKGPDGDPGITTGATGVAGATGEAGPTGQLGEAGPTGDVGGVGPTGQAGEAGPTGQAGEAGPTGQAGEAGETGVTGPAGTTLGLTVGTTGGVGATGYSDVNTILFDLNSGFDVTPGPTGTVTIGMNSTFKYWEIDGNLALTAVGIDTVNFVAGPGISMTGGVGPSGTQYLEIANTGTGSIGATGEAGPVGATGDAGVTGEAGATGQAG